MIEQKVSILNITREELSELIKQSVMEIKEELLFQPDILLDNKQAVELFIPTISTQTLTNWTKAGKIESVRKGGRVYYSRNEIMSKSKILKKFKI